MQRPTVYARKRSESNQWFSTTRSSFDISTYAQVSDVDEVLKTVVGTYHDRRVSTEMLGLPEYRSFSVDGAKNVQTTAQKLDNACH